MREIQKRLKLSDQMKRKHGEIGAEEPLPPKKYAKMVAPKHATSRLSAAHIRRRQRDTLRPNTPASPAITAATTKALLAEKQNQK